MFRKPAVRTERKNVVLRDDVIKTLESVSEYTGRNQSDILELAMSQPAICRLDAFVNAEDAQAGCIGALIREYAMSRPALAADLTVAILEAVKMHYLPTAEGILEPDSERWHDLGQLTPMFIPNDTADVCPKLYYIRERAREAAEHRDDMSSPLAGRDDDPTCKVLEYIDTILAYRHQPKAIMEESLLQFLALWLELALAPPTEKQKKDMYLFLAKRGVFGQPVTSCDMAGPEQGWLSTEGIILAISRLSGFAEEPAGETLKQAGIKNPSEAAVQSVHLCRLYAGLLSGQLVNAANLASKDFVMSGITTEPLFDYFGLNAEDPCVQRLNDALNQVHEAATAIFCAQGQRPN